tara:strand:+ start:2187 stop:2720 length:534 start_codon:yes stop_codon:yes gene_type:complete
MKYTILLSLYLINCINAFSQNPTLVRTINNSNTCINSNKKLLYNALSLLKASIYNDNTNTNNNWEPPVGYVPESLKIVEKKWEPPVGYVPETLRSSENNKIIQEIDNKISTLNDSDSLYTNVKDETKYIKEQTKKLEEETKILKDIIKKINYHTDNIATSTLYRNEDYGHNYYPKNN